MIQCECDNARLQYKPTVIVYLCATQHMEHLAYILTYNMCSSKFAAWYLFRHSQLNLDINHWAICVHMYIRMT